MSHPLFKLVIKKKQKPHNNKKKNLQQFSASLIQVVQLFNYFLVCQSNWFCKH